MKKLISVILSATLLMTMTVHAMASNDSISAENQADIINETTPSESSEKMLKKGLHPIKQSWSFLVLAVRFCVTVVGRLVGFGLQLIASIRLLAPPRVLV